MSSNTAWGQMIARCYDPKHPKFHRYGGRGIRVCDRWICRRLFIEDMGERPEGMTLNRLNNDGNYSKDNCEWSTSVAQSRNKGNNRLLDFGGRTLCVSQWAEEIGIKRRTLQNRIESGWSVELALTTPVSSANASGRMSK